MSKKNQKLKEEIFQFLLNAFSHAKKNSIPKDKLVGWLHTKNIAFKKMLFHPKTLVPHVQIEFLDKETGKLHEFEYPLTILEGKSLEEVYKDIERDMEKQALKNVGETK